MKKWNNIKDQLSLHLLEVYIAFFQNKTALYRRAHIKKHIVTKIH